MHQHEKINYVEFPSNDLKATKKFFENVFAWEFTDYGEQYTAFSNQGLDGGFYLCDLSSTASHKGALLVFYSEDLAQTKVKILKYNGKISKDTFDFPGGKRFHFVKPGGNELAIWSDK